MGEGRRSDDQAATDQATGRRMTVPEAAEALGISQDAVRSRIKRGTLTSVRDGGRVFVVLVGPDRPTDRAQPTNEPGGERLYQEMRERISYLERQVEEEREARLRADTLLARLMDRVPELEAPQEAADASETVEEATDELEAERTRREMAETTLHEGMAEQRRRREEAERERDDLRRELHARGRRTEAQEAVEQQGRGQPQSATGGAQEGIQRPRSRPWWRRIIGR